MEVIDHLLADPQARVLIVATAWPHALGASAGRELDSVTGEDELDGEVSPFVSWWRSRDGLALERSERVDLAPLGDDDLAAIVGAELPGLDREVVRALMAHVGHNPLTVRILVRTKRIQKALMSRGFTAAGVAEFPSEVEQALDLYWQSIPEPVRERLARAALLGNDFVAAPVLAAAAAQGIDTAEAGLRQGVDPYSWVRDLDEFVQGFLEPAMRQDRTP